jgi:hypothetical protein
MGRAISGSFSVAALAAIGVLLAGCGSGSSTASDDAPASVSTTPAGTASSTPPSSAGSAEPYSLDAVDTAAWVSALRAKHLVDTDQPDLQKLYDTAVTTCRASANQLALKYSRNGGARALSLDRVDIRFICPTQMHKVGGATDTLD